MNHPNAAVGTSTGVGGGSLVIYLLGLFGWHVDNYAAVAIAAAVSGVALFIGRNGIKGAWRRIIHGPGETVQP